VFLLILHAGAWLTGTSSNTGGRQALGEDVQKKRTAWEENRRFWFAKPLRWRRRLSLEGA
jgi:hypothetical protein